MRRRNEIIGPALKKRATDWMIGLQNEIKRLNNIRVAKAQKRNTWTPIPIDHLIPGDIFKLKGKNSPVRVLLDIKRPRPGIVRLETRQKKGAKFDCFLLPETHTVFRLLEAAGEG